MRTKFEGIYDWFEKLGSFTIRFRWFVIAFFALLMGVAALGLPKIELSVSTDDWFEEGEEVKQAQDRFDEMFGGSEYAAMLIEADDVFAPEILTMMRRLGDDLLTEIEFADSVTSLADIEIILNEDGKIVSRELVPEEIPRDPEEIEKIRRIAYGESGLVDLFFTADGRQTWLILEFLPFPDEWEDRYETSPREISGQQVLDILARPEYRGFTIKPTGMVVLNVEEMAFYQSETPLLVVIAMTVLVVILALFLRSLRGVVVPLISTVVSLIIVFGFSGHFGLEMIASLMSLPIFLTLAVSIGYSIHIFNIFRRQFVAGGDRKQAVRVAVRETGWPILFTAMTTVGALMSFCSISLLPLQWLGVVSASLILCVYLTVTMLSPALLSFGKDREPGRFENQDRIFWTDSFFRWLGGWVYTRSRLVIIVFVVIIGFFAWGFTKAEVGSDFKRTYGDKVPFIQRITEISESDIGYFYSYNITLGFPDPGVARDPRTLRNLELFSERLRALDNTKSVVTILHIIKDMNQLLNDDDPEFYRLPDDEATLTSCLSVYEELGTDLGDWVDKDFTTLRLKVAVDEVNEVEMREAMDVVAEEAARIFPEAETSIVGLLPSMVALNHHVSIGLIRSLLVALGVIMVLMMIVFRSIKTGLIGMIPNITPVIVIGGAMGHMNFPLDFMTMTMLPMLLGLAVDDTIHFITHANVEYSRLGDYRKAIERTLSVTGRSLFMTSFIIVAAFAVYLTADMRAMVNFGIFITLGISSALAADYFITPVCLKWLKPFGKSATGPDA